MTTWSHVSRNRAAQATERRWEEPGAAGVRHFRREDGHIDFKGPEVALCSGGERAGVVDALDREDLVDRTADRGNALRNDLASRDEHSLADLHCANHDSAHDRVHERLAQSAERTGDGIVDVAGRVGDGGGDGADDRGEMEVVAMVAMVPVVVVRDVDVVRVVAVVYLNPKGLTVVLDTNTDTDTNMQASRHAPKNIIIHNAFASR
jgi:hypothetical protein